MIPTPYSGGHDDAEAVDPAGDDQTRSPGVAARGREDERGRGAGGTVTVRAEDGSSARSSSSSVDARSAATTDPYPEIRIEPIVEPIVTDEDHDEWLLLFANRNEVSEEYAVLLRRNGPQWDGWRKINEAVMRRWSMAGLKYIKERAWKIATQNL